MKSFLYGFGIRVTVCGRGMRGGDHLELEPKSVEVRGAETMRVVLVAGCAHGGYGLKPVVLRVKVRDG